MPEKTHLRSVCESRAVWRAALFFELHRRPVSERGMQPQPIVVAFQKLFDMRLEILQIAIFPAINLLLFESLHKTFTGGIGEGRQLHRMTTMAIPLLKSSTHT